MRECTHSKGVGKWGKECNWIWTQLAWAQETEVLQLMLQPRDAEKPVLAWNMVGTGNPGD